LCSPRGVAQEFTALKASIEALAGSAGVAEYYGILRKHFRSMQPARLCAKDVYSCSSNSGPMCGRARASKSRSRKSGRKQKCCAPRRPLRWAKPMANEIVRAQPNNCTLYEIEDSLAPFANTVDLAPDEPTRQLVLDEIGQALRKAKDKRDAVVAFLRHCEQQQEFADAEIERIEKRKEFIARVREELERYVIQVIEQFAAPDRRGIKRLEGNVSSLRIQKNPDSVVITDVTAISLAQKNVTLTMAAHVWEALLQIVGPNNRKEFESRVERLEYKPDKKTIAADLKNGISVPGADLKFGDWRLVIG